MFACSSSGSSVATETENCNDMKVENKHTAETEHEETKNGNETITIQTYLGDEDEDVHKCGRCQVEFSTLESFIQHKLHQSCKRVDSVPENSHDVQDQELETSKASMSTDEEVVQAESSSESAATNANGDDGSPRDRSRRSKSPKRTKESQSGKVDDKNAFKANPDGRYLCQLCPKTFKTSNILRTHLKTHTDKKNFSCELCETSFRTKGSLIRHNRRHTDERPYRCNLCGISFRESGALTRHRKSRTPCTEKIRFVQYKEILVSKDGQQKGVSDNQAGEQEVIVLGELSEDEAEEVVAAQTAVVSLVEAGSPEVIHQVHFTMEVDSTTQEQQVVVESSQAEALAAAVGDNLICQAIINSGLALKEDEEVHGDHQMEEISVMVGECPDAEGTEIQIKDEFVELKTDESDGNSSPSKPYVCPHCGRSFKGLNYYRFHVNGHAGKPFKCNICQRDFQTGYLLRKHLENHGSERRYKCGECGKLYKTIGHIREHMRSHSDVRPFHCSRCNKGYKTKNALQVHQRIHGEERPYVCQFCPRRFREKGSLVRHIRHHTGEKPFKCPKCGRGFAEHGTLNRHMRAKGGCRKEEFDKHGVATEETSGDGEATAAIMADDPNAVLVEFSSVVADTQEYIINTQSDDVQEESQSEMSTQIMKVVQQLVSQSHGKGSHQIIVRHASINQEGASISDCGDTITIATPQNLTEQVAMTLANAIGDGTLLTTTEADGGTIAMLTTEGGVHEEVHEEVQVVQEEYVIASPELEIQTFFTELNAEDLKMKVR